MAGSPFFRDGTASHSKMALLIRLPFHSIANAQFFVLGALSNLCLLTSEFQDFLRHPSASVTCFLSISLWIAWSISASIPAKTLKRCACFRNHGIQVEARVLRKHGADGLPNLLLPKQTLLRHYARFSEGGKNPRIPFSAKIGG